LNSSVFDLAGEDLVSKSSDKVEETESRDGCKFSDSSFFSSLVFARVFFPLSSHASSSSWSSCRTPESWTPSSPASSQPLLVSSLSLCLSTTLPDVSVIGSLDSSFLRFSYDSFPHHDSFFLCFVGLLFSLLRFLG
jgi:hypothetical protein